MLAENGPADACVVQCNNDETDDLLPDYNDVVAAEVVGGPAAEEAAQDAAQKVAEVPDRLDFDPKITNQRRHAYPSKPRLPDPKTTKEFFARRKQQVDDWKRLKEEFVSIAPSAPPLALTESEVDGDIIIAGVTDARARHCKAWILTLIVVASSLGFLANLLLFLYIVPVIIIVYIAYLVEAFVFSSTFKYLKYNNSCDQGTAAKHIEDMYSQAPRLWWRMDCYHETGSGDNKSTTYTNLLSANYQYGSWRDVSKKWRGFGTANVTTLQMDAKHTFATAEAEYMYNMAEEQWYKENKQDKSQHFTRGLDIENWQSMMLVKSCPGAKPWWMCEGCYIITSLLLCTTCFRLCFDKATEHKEHVFEKEVDI